MFQQSEIAGLISKNVVTLLIAGLILLVPTAFASSRKRITAQRIALGVFLFLPWMVRFFSNGYAYDTRFALLSELSDIIIVAYFCFLLGQKLAGVTSPAIKISIGIAVATLSGLIFTSLGLHRIHPQPSSITNLIFVVLIGFVLVKNIPSDPLRVLAKDCLLFLFVAVLFAYSFHYFFLVPSAPDADITSMGEILGYLFQGQNLDKVATGFGEEWVLRYPAGFPSLAFVFSHLLNVRASEAMLLFWYLSFFIFIFSLISLGRKFALNPFLIGLFSLNGAVTGWFGLRGGQAHEMLAYSLGLVNLTLLLERQWLAAAICLSASIVLHPVIALPFCVVFGIFLIRDFSKEQLTPIVAGIAVLVCCVGYIGFLGLGPSSTPSQPQILLSELSITVFVSNILKYFKEDTLGYGVFLLAIPLFSILFSKKSSQSLLIFYAWFIGCILIDGLFGHTHWTARFQKSFNLIGIWILSVGFAQRVWNLLWERLTSSFSANRRILFGAHLAGIGGLLAFWLIVAAPMSTVLPSPIYSTHAAIRMGRFMEDNLPKDGLIYFKRLYTDVYGNSLENLNMLRGDSSRNTTEGRIFDHHIKVGSIKSREPVNACLTLMPAAKMVECFKGFGVDYLLLETGVIRGRDEAKRISLNLEHFPLILEHQVADTYLFKLRP